MSGLCAAACSSERTDHAIQCCGDLHEDPDQLEKESLRGGYSEPRRRRWVSWSSDLGGSGSNGRSPNSACAPEEGMHAFRRPAWSPEFQRGELLNQIARARESHQPRVMLTANEVPPFPETSPATARENAERGDANEGRNTRACRARRTAPSTLMCRGKSKAGQDCQPRVLRQQREVPPPTTSPGMTAHQVRRTSLRMRWFSLSPI